MFLDSGDGVVFKAASVHGARGKREHYHLKDPEELFIHGRTSFNDDEWAGFEAAAGNSTRVVGVTITCR